MWLCFSGGMELLFDGRKKLDVVLDDGSTTKDLIRIIATDYLKSRHELFVKDDTVYHSHRRIFQLIFS